MFWLPFIPPMLCTFTWLDINPYVKTAGHSWVLPSESSSFTVSTIHEYSWFRQDYWARETLEMIDVNKWSMMTTWFILNQCVFTEEPKYALYYIDFYFTETGGYQRLWTHTIFSINWQIISKYLIYYSLQPYEVGIITLIVPERLATCPRHYS